MSDECRYIDLRMRLPNDGSLMFQVLSGLPTTAARNARACQLMMLGAILESGRLGGLAIGTSMTSTVPDPAGRHSANPPRVAPVEPIMDGSARTAPDAADVMTVFG